MTKEQTLAPKLRFGKSEERGPLETVVFDELFVFSQGKNIKHKEAAPHFETPCVRYGELYHMYSEVITEVINRTNLDPAELRFSEGNEILLPSAGEDPLDIGSASALMLKGVAIGRTINVLQPKGTREYDQRFASYYINRILRKRISQLARGASISNVYNSDLKELTICLPPLAEQLNIAEFLTSLDRIIGLHQRKHDKLVTLKQAMLQKMFPQDGATTPEIRFKGFDGEWKPKKLSDVCDSFQYGLNAAAKKYDGWNKYLRITDINEASRQFSQSNLTTPDTDLENSEDYLLSEGDLLFARTGASVGKTYRYTTLDGRVYFAGFLIRAQPRNVDCADFLFYSTLTMAYDKFVVITSQRSGQPGINAEEYSNFEFRVPLEPEQQKIGTYFRKLDELITKHMTQLEKLKNIKSACLEKMFV